MFVGGGGDTTNGAKHAESDFAVCNQFRDVGQGYRKGCGVLRDNLLV
jgi:hypothetical protein